MGSMEGLLVVEVGTSVAAPFATQILGDLGADVVKVERIGSGDDTRGWGPPFWDGESTTFLALNRNKRSLALDFKQEVGAEVLHRLLERADVLVQNLRPGAFDRAGFSWKVLHERNPGLVYCEMTGYGHDGPRADDPAYDPLLQAYSGIVSLTGEEGRPPVRVPVSLLDQGTGMWAALGILDALWNRDRTGQGAHVEVSLLATAMSWLSLPMASVLAGNPPPQRLGSGLAGVAPYGAFACADGHVFLSAGNQPLWERLCASLGRPDLVEDPRFATNSDRSRNRAELTDALEDVLTEFTVEAALSRFRETGVPCAPVNGVADAAKDAQVQASGVLAATPHPRIDGFTTVRTPVRQDGAWQEHRLPPPDVGGDTDAVLGDLGFTPEEVAGLFEAGTVGRPGEVDERDANTTEIGTDHARRRR